MVETIYNFTASALNNAVFGSAHRTSWRRERRGLSFHFFAAFKEKNKPTPSAQRESERGGTPVFGRLLLCVTETKFVEHSRFELPCSFLVIGALERWHRCVVAFGHFQVQNNGGRNRPAETGAIFLPFRRHHHHDHHRARQRHTDAAGRNQRDFRSKLCLLAALSCWRCSQSENECKCKRFRHCALLL